MLSEYKQCSSNVYIMVVWNVWDFNVSRDLVFTYSIMLAADCPATLCILVVAEIYLSHQWSWNDNKHWHASTLWANYFLGNNIQKKMMPCIIFPMLSDCHLYLRLPTFFRNADDALCSFHCLLSSQSVHGKQNTYTKLHKYQLSLPGITLCSCI